MRDEELFPRKITCGAATSVFGHRMTLSAAKIARLVGTGLEWIEIAALQEQHICLRDEERLSDLEEGLAKLPIRVWSIHAPFCAIAMDDEETRAEATRRIVRTGEVAQRFGAACVVIHPGRDVPSRDRERELRWTVENVLRALEKMPDGVSLALETMGGESLGGPLEEMLAILEQLPADRAGVCVDTGHVNTFTAPSPVIRALAGRVVSLHLQDNLGEKDDHLLAGSGVIRWPEVAAALREAGYRGVLMSEGADPGRTPEENAREFVRRMRGLFAA